MEGVGFKPLRVSAQPAASFMYVKKNERGKLYVDVGKNPALQLKIKFSSLLQLWRVRWNIYS